MSKFWSNLVYSRKQRFFQYINYIYIHILYIHRRFRCQFSLTPVHWCLRFVFNCLITMTTISTSCWRYSASLVGRLLKRWLTLGTNNLLIDSRIWGVPGNPAVAIFNGKCGSKHPWDFCVFHGFPRFFLSQSGKATSKGFLLCHPREGHDVFFLFRSDLVWILPVYYIEIVFGSKPWYPRVISPVIW